MRSTHLPILILILASASPSLGIFPGGKSNPGPTTEANQLSQKQVLEKIGYSAEELRAKIYAVQKIQEGDKESIKIWEMRTLKSDLEAKAKDQERRAAAMAADERTKLLLEEEFKVQEKKVISSQERLRVIEESVGNARDPDAPINDLDRWSTLGESATKGSKAKAELTTLKKALRELKEKLTAVEKNIKNGEKVYKVEWEEFDALKIEILKGGGTLPESAPVKSLIEGSEGGIVSKMLQHRGKILFGFLLAGAITVGLKAILDPKGFMDFFRGNTAPVDANKMAPTKDTSARFVMKEACVGMYSAALKVDGIAIDKYPEGSAYHLMLKSLPPVWDLAYANAARSVIANVSTQVPVNWGAPAPFPALAFISNGTSLGDKLNIAKERELNLDNHALNEYIRPMHLQHLITVQQNDAVHQGALVAMRNSPDLPASAHADHFEMAYTSMFAWTNIPNTCSPYYTMDKATAARYKASLALAVVRDADINAALQLNFDARSALPATDPLPAIQATA